MNHPKLNVLPPQSFLSPAGTMKSSQSFTCRDVILPTHATRSAAWEMPLRGLGALLGLECLGLIFLQGWHHCTSFFPACFACRPSAKGPAVAHSWYHLKSSVPSSGSPGPVSPRADLLLTTWLQIFLNRLLLFYLYLGLFLLFEIIPSLLILTSSSG